MSERLRQARTQAGFASAADAAKRFGWPETTYRHHENGHRGFPAAKANLYGRAYKVSPEWLLFGSEGVQPRDVAPPEKTGDLVPIYNVQASAGHGALVPGPEEIADRLAFPPGYLRSFTSANSRNLAIIGVKGESMLPTLSDNDVVMVDLGKTDLSFEGLFVLRDGGESLLVKRVGRATRRGHVMLISDNRAYPPVERAIEDIEVVGKVVWMGVRV